jgi:hypothetical protein
MIILLQDLVEKVVEVVWSCKHDDRVTSLTRE